MKCFLALILILTFFLPFAASAAMAELLLRENLKRAQPGDYLVTAQNKNYTTLLIRSKTEETLSIEEITIPMARISQEGFSWRQWVQQGAPGHTCWIMYTIHLSSGTMQKTFSFTRNEWVTIPEAQNFFSTLLNLRLKLVDENERKKVGVPRSSDTVDRRRLWQPALVVDGKVVPEVYFDAWRTRWPSDNSELSGKIIEVYIPKENDKFPSYFPYWLQISGIVGNAKVRIVDSGSDLASPRQNCK
ncbi:MAG: hypothetical protein WCF65_01840 [Parachlamydiaceae bacterium]